MSGTSRNKHKRSSDERFPGKGSNIHNQCISIVEICPTALFDSLSSVPMEPLYGDVEDQTPQATIQTRRCKPHFAPENNRWQWLPSQHGLYCLPYHGHDVVHRLQNEACLDSLQLGSFVGLCLGLCMGMWLSCSSCGLISSHVCIRSIDYTSTKATVPIVTLQSRVTAILRPQTSSSLTL